MTVFPVPTAALSNVAAPLQVRTSSPIVPVKVHDVSVARVVPSYVLFATVTVGVTVTDMIAAEDVAVEFRSA